MKLQTATVGDLKRLLNQLHLHNGLPLFRGDDWGETEPYGISDLEEALKIQWLCYSTRDCQWDIRSKKACKRLKVRCQGVVL